jgi:hypothetical protein
MLPPSHGEELQIARYGKNERYEFHHDTDKRMARLATVIIYLSTPDRGGETIFPFADLRSTHDAVPGGELPPPLDPWDLKKGLASMDEYCTSSQYESRRIKAVKGRAVVFYSMHPNLQLSEFAWHGGCPVLEGEKFLAQRWIKTSADPTYAAGLLGTSTTSGVGKTKEPDDAPESCAPETDGRMGEGRGKRAGMACHFPFLWRGQTHKKCITGSGAGNVPWCCVTKDCREWGSCRCSKGENKTQLPGGVKRKRKRGRRSGGDL